MQTTTENTLIGQRDERAGRLADLKAQRAEITENRAGHERILDAAKADLASGECNVKVEVLTAAEDQAAQCDRTLAHLDEAIAKVDAEHRELQQQIDAAETIRERKHQQKASQALRAQIDAAEAEFASNFANIAGSLRKRMELVEKLRDEFPLANPPADLTLDRLARQVQPLWRGPGGIPRAKEDDVREFCRGIELMLLGPLFRKGYGLPKATVLADLGIVG